MNPFLQYASSNGSFWVCNEIGDFSFCNLTGLRVWLLCWQPLVCIRFDLVCAQFPIHFLSTMHEWRAGTLDILQSESEIRDAWWNTYPYSLDLCISLHYWMRRKQADHIPSASAANIVTFVTLDASPCPINAIMSRLTTLRRSRARSQYLPQYPTGPATCDGSQQLGWYHATMLTMLRISYWWDEINSSMEIPWDSSCCLTWAKAVLSLHNRRTCWEKFPQSKAEVLALAAWCGIDASQTEVDEKVRYNDVQQPLVSLLSWHCNAEIKVPNGFKSLDQQSRHMDIILVILLDAVLCRNVCIISIPEGFAHT